MTKQLMGTGQFSLTKVKQGESGQSAKYVTISGDQIFRYADSAMTSIPDPAQITLTASIYNVNATKVEWFYRTSNTSDWQPVQGQTKLYKSVQDGLTGKSEYIVNPSASMWSGKTSLTFACIVDNDYYDAVSVIKLAEGETYSAILTNENQTVSTDINGNIDQTELSSIYTEVQVFRGTELLSFASGNDKPEVRQYTLKIVNNNNLDASINTTNGRIENVRFIGDYDIGNFDVEISVSSSNSQTGGLKIIRKTFTLSKAKQGEQGPQGDSAKQVTVSGQNLFTVGADIKKTVTPNDITITGVYSNIDNPSMKLWQHHIGNDQWANILHRPGVTEILDSASNYGTLKIYPDALSLKEEHHALVRYWVDGYWDEISIAQVSESSGYITTLTNSTHTVAADKEGGILEGELSEAFTDIQAYKNTEELVAVEREDSLDQGKFYAKLIEVLPQGAENIIINPAPGKFALSSMAKEANTITGKIRIYFENSSNYQDKILTFTKSLTGADGAPGEDAYVLSLEKEHGIIKITHDEGVSLSDYDDVYTTAVVYQGGKKLPKYSGGAKGVEYLVSPASGEDITYKATTSPNGELSIDVTFMRTYSGYIDIQANIIDNVDGEDVIVAVTHRRFAVMILSEGKDPKYVEVKTDENTFIFENKTISINHEANKVSPSFIRLTGFIYNFKPEANESRWQYLKSKTENGETWEDIKSPTEAEYIHIPSEKAYKVTLDIDPYTYWKNTSSILTVRYVANNNIMYSDSLTLQRVQDNKKLSAALTNENVTIPANSEGIVDSFEDACTGFSVYHGNDKLDSDEFIAEITSDATGAVVDKVDGEWKIYLTSMAKSFVSYAVRVSITTKDEITDEETVQIQDLTFTVSKALQGNQGPQGEQGEQGPEGPAGPDGKPGENGEDGLSVFVRYLASGFDRRLIDPLPELHTENTKTVSSGTDTLILSTKNDTSEAFISFYPTILIDTHKYKYFAVNYRVREGNPNAFRLSMVGTSNGEEKVFGPTGTESTIKTDGWNTAFIDITKTQDGWASYPQANAVKEFRLHWTTNLDTGIKLEIAWVALTMEMGLESSDFMGVYTGLTAPTDVNEYYWSKLKTNADYVWLQDWNQNKTLIGNKYIVSPEAFFGQKDVSTDKYSGIAMNMLIPGDQSEEKGIVGYNNSIRTFTIDSKTGVATFGSVNNGLEDDDSYLQVGPDGVVGNINAGNITVNNINASNINTGTLNAEEVNVVNLNAENITAGNIDADRITAGVIDAVNANIGSAVIDQAKIGDLSADKITTGELDASKINVTNLNANNISTGSLSADFISGGTIDANLINVENINADNIKTGSIDANEIEVKNLNASNIIAGTIDASKVKVENLDASNIVAGEIDADLINVKNINGQNIKANTIEGGSITADSITTDHLKTGAVTSDTIAAGTITAGNIATGAITAGSGVIAEGAIGSAQISELNASKIKAGTIDTSLVKVASANSSIEISGNQIMVNDTTDPLNKKNRVTLGEYILNGIKNFGLVIRGKDGKTVMIDENGVHNAGITDGAVDNNKVSDNANISGKKLDIDSVVRTINEDGSETITGTKIQVGDRTLDIELSTQQSQITDNSTNITNQSAQIKALDDKIQLKVESSEFDRFEETVTDKIEDIASNIPYKVEIYSSNGNSFVNNNIDTVLTARVYRGKEDVTHLIPDEDFTWIRESTDKQDDIEWNSSHIGFGNEVHVTADDFHKRAIFNVDINLPIN